MRQEPVVLPLGVYSGRRPWKAPVDLGSGAEDELDLTESCCRPHGFGERTRRGRLRMPRRPRRRHTDFARRHPAVKTRPRPPGIGRPILTELFLSPTARAWLDNLHPSRSRAGRLQFHAFQLCFERGIWVCANAWIWPTQPVLQSP